jgi:hypothetical protein
VEVGKACGRHGGVEKCLQSFGQQIKKEDLGMCRRIVLRWIIKK